MSGIAAELRKIPPVTRFLCASSLAVTIPVLMNVVSLYKTFYTHELVLKKFQVWRLYTGFFMGGGGIQYIFEFAMLYRTSDQLESGRYFRRSADYAYQLMLASLTIVAISTPLKPFFFARPLLVCMAYLSSSLAPLGTLSNFMGLFSFPVIYLPYTMIAVDLLMGGPAAVALSITGAVVGHFWHWGVWGGRQGATIADGPLAEWGKAPEWMKRLFGELGAPPPSDIGGGGVRVIPPRRNLATGGSGGNTASGSGSTTTTTGYNWGRGQKLGSS